MSVSSKAVHSLFSLISTCLRNPTKEWSWERMGGFGHVTFVPKILLIYLCLPILSTNTAQSPLSFLSASHFKCSGHTLTTHLQSPYLFTSVLTAQ